MFQKSEQILYNHNVGEGYHCIGFSSPDIAQHVQPGQFLMLRMGEETWEGKLSRPFSISNVKDDIVEIVIEVVGKNTKNLAGAEKGQVIHAIGPLGNGFAIDKEAEVHILIAGGIGIAPFQHLAISIHQENPKSKVILLFGVRSVSRLLLTRNLEEYEIDMKLASDDGTIGYHGLVSDLFIQELDMLEGKKAVAYGCGPDAMLKAISAIAVERDIPCQLSLEEVMACGVGACLGCARKVRNGDGWTYKMVCKDGPVFDAKEIIWDED